MTVPQMRRCEVEIDGEIHRFTPTRHRLLVLLLLADPSRFVSSEEIVDWLWPDPDYSPETPEQNVAVHISRLRTWVPIENMRQAGLLYRKRGGYRIPPHVRGLTAIA